jgi:hypothetical protein
MQRCYCDLCGKELVAGADHRIVVRMDARLVAAPLELTDADLDGQDDPDHIEAMDVLLAEQDGEDTVLDPTPTPRPQEFDLCGACYRRFQADPLGLERSRKLYFSPN